jgi:redox-sensitive bicupin YhaK (pirin superfamily)
LPTTAGCRPKHSFSFADYYDPAEMGWGVLRVINEDRVAPGIPASARHGHRDMEIVTYILSGALEHKDSLGHGGIIRRGEVQRMTAGKGILHSEANPLPDQETHLLQIWIEPAQRGTPASYEQQALARGRHAWPLAPGRLARWRRRQHHDRPGRPPVGQPSWPPASASTTAWRRAVWPTCRLSSGRLEINGKTMRCRSTAPRLPRKGADSNSWLAKTVEFLLFDLPPPVV